MFARDLSQSDYTSVYPVVEWAENGMAFGVQAPIISEYRIMVEVNGAVCMSVMCTPGQDTELVVGRLFTEGFIDALDEVSSLEFECLNDCCTLARVRLACEKGMLVKTPVIDVLSVGAGSQVVRRFKDRENLGSFLSPGVHQPWCAQDIFTLDRLFSKDSPLHKLTSGTHSTYLLQKDGSICCFEDIGRHNTVDKAIGWALIHHIDRSQVMAFISGRVPTDMMVKAVRAKFCVFASRKTPTREAIDMARAYRVTLVGDVEKGRLKVFSGPQPTFNNNANMPDQHEQSAFSIAV